MSASCRLVHRNERQPVSSPCATALRVLVGPWGARQDSPISLDTLPGRHLHPQLWFRETRRVSFPDAPVPTALILHAYFFGIRMSFFMSPGENCDAPFAGLLVRSLNWSPGLSWEAPLVVGGAEGACI
jgi:hypothetical protein